MMGEKTYILRTCAADGSSSHGFVWPDNGPVEAPDWDPKTECGHGLHGLLLGRGDGGLLDWSDDARWIVAEVDVDTVVDLYGKVKFPRAEVVYCGDRGGATDYLMDCGAIGVAGATVTAGDYGTATAGSHGTATAGDYGTATAGDDGIIIVTYWDEPAGRRRVVVGYVGENGIARNVPYRVSNGQLVEVKAEGSLA